MKNEISVETEFGKIEVKNNGDENFTLLFYQDDIEKVGKIKLDIYSAIKLNKALEAILRLQRFTEVG